MSVVKSGDTIRIHYTGKLEDGTVFDTSEDGGASLEIKIGQGEFIAGLEKGVIGMAPGEKKTLHIPAEEAYGPHIKERVFQYEKAKLGDMEVHVGGQLQMYMADGRPVLVTISEIGENTVTMDCNHPLAGKNLVFDITLEEIV